MTPRFDTILITGAAGRLGTELRRGLAPLARRLRLADKAPVADLAPNEEALGFDLADEAAVHAACAGVDAIVHFGGVPLERPWAEILDANIRGSYHIYEGARKHGVKRVVYASSVHAIGYHRLEDQIDAAAPHRPDGLYGLSKCFVEDLGRLYWDKFGIETAALRIFSSFPEPADRRMLWSWLSFEDCIRLASAALTAPRLGFTVSFGISDNAVQPVDNRLAGHLGYRPQDNTEAFRAALEGRTPPPDPKAPAVQCLGGWFVDLGHPDDEAGQWTDAYDVVIVGGAVIGSAVAYFLTANPDFTGRVLVVERDPSYQRAATSLSSSSIRTQFSNPINVRISQYGSEFIRNFGAAMQVAGEAPPDLNFHQGGYLFLANTPEQEQVLRENHQVQRACGADVVLWGPEALARAFPHLRVDDIRLASYGQSGEGWFNNTGLMHGFKAKAREQGADYITDEAVAIGRDGARVTSVTLKSGAVVKAGTVVNASGPRAALTARMAGLDVPVEPRKRTLFVFDCARTPEGSATVNQGRLPLMIDPSGVFCRPEGRFFLSGAPPVEDPAVDWDDFEPRYAEFEDIIWPALAERSAGFEAIKVVNQWAGHYDFNTLDHNLIVGRHPEVANFIYANGFSGHGLQQGPATGRGIAELIIYGGFRSLDLSEVGYERILENRPFLEKAVI